MNFHFLSPDVGYGQMTGDRCNGEFIFLFFIQMLEMVRRHVTDVMKVNFPFLPNVRNCQITEDRCNES